MDQVPGSPPPENRAREMEQALIELGAKLATIRRMAILGGMVLIIVILGALALFIFLQARP